MRFIWKPGSQQKMHYQRHSIAGEPMNGSLCGIVFNQGWRTINPPFALGRGVCKHCKRRAARTTLKDAANE